MTPYLARSPWHGCCTGTNRPPLEQILNGCTFRLPTTPHQPLEREAPSHHHTHRSDHFRDPIQRRSFECATDPVITGAWLGLRGLRLPACAQCCSPVPSRRRWGAEPSLRELCRVCFRRSQATLVLQRRLLSSSN